MARANQAVATADDKSTAAAVYDYGADAGLGYEGFSSSDYSIPYLSVLQGLSPQVTDNNPAGARPGMIYNTVTGELIDGNEGVVFQCAELHKKYVEWVPRDAGGGLVAIFDPSDPEVSEAINYSASKNLKYGKLETPAGNSLIETYYAYGLILDETGEESKGFALMSFTSTKIKPTKNWLTIMRTTMKGKIPILAYRTVLRTSQEKGDKGTFYNVQFSPFGGKGWVESVLTPGHALLAEAKKFREMVLTGKAKADLSQTASSGGEAAGDKEIPF